MSHQVVDLENPQSIEIEQRRWDIRITVVTKEGETLKYIASADSNWAQGDGIWFGTPEEYEEAR